MSNPYREALQWIQQNPGTGGSVSMAKLILSLWNSDCGYSFRECIGSLDSELTAVALRMVQHFAQHGEDRELVEVGHIICERYPRLWDAAMAMSQARYNLGREWERADEEEAHRLNPDD
jgi:hypothetical protein